MADQTPDPWKDVQPFKLMLLSDLQSGVTESTLYHAEAVDRARAADQQTIQQQAAQIETLTQALAQQKRWAEFLESYLDENHDSRGSYVAWSAFIDKEHESLPVLDCECERCRAAGASRPTEGEQGLG